MGLFTYENQGANTILVYSLDQNENMDTLAVGMVANNKIDGVLSPGFVQKNMLRQLKYNISSKITLQQFFSRTVKKKQLTSIFRSLTETIMQAEKYLLGEESFLLDWEHVYVNVGDSKAYLLCFPIEKDMDEKLDYYEFIHRLIYEVKFDENEDCAYVASLMNYINKKDGFSFRGFVEMLEHMELEHSVAGEKKDSGQSSAKTEMTHWAENIIQNAAASSSTKAQISQKEAESKNKKITEKPLPDQEMDPDEKKKAKKKMFKLPFGKKEKPNKQKKQSFAIPNQQKITEQNVNQNAIPKQKDVQKDVMQREEPVIKTADNANHYEKGTTLLKDPGTTVLISGENNPTTLIGQSGQHKVSITQMRNGIKMDIQKDVFCIGKSKNFVDFYVADNSTVSRSHADILTTYEGVYIRDNNSLNHTYVNEQLVPAGTQVMLSDGDIIRLSDEKFMVSIQ